MGSGSSQLATRTTAGREDFSLVEFQLSRIYHEEVVFFYIPSPDVGLEPTATSLKGWRSTDWANRVKYIYIQLHNNIYNFFSYLDSNQSFGIQSPKW